MRKLLVSAMSAGIIAAPATMAFGAEDNRNDDLEASPARFPLSEVDPLVKSGRRVQEAAERVEEVQEKVRERREQRQLELAQAEEEAATAPAPVSSGSTSPELDSIAQCESGGDYSANTGNGFYGAYQFTPETWASVGGSGLPSEASPAEQDMRAQMLLEQSGSSPWPVCG